MNILVWWKRNGGMGDLKHTLKEDYELALLLAKGRPIVSHRRGSVFDFDIDNKEDHPTAKPIGLMKAILQAIGKPKEKVLDPFMGIGSTGIACGLLDMDFMGIEIEKRYYDIAKKRIEGTIPEIGEQMKLI